MDFQAVGRLRGHRGCVVSVCAASTGEALSASEDGSLRLWDLRCQRSVRAIFVESAINAEVGSTLGSCSFLCPTEPSRAVLVAAGTELLAYDLRASDRVLLRGPPNASSCAADDINDFAVAPDGSVVAVPTDAGDIQLLCADDLSPIRNLSGGHQNIVGCARFRAEGTELFSGGFDERLVLWDPRNAKRRCMIEARQLVPEAEEDSQAVGSARQILNPPFILSLSVGPEESLALGLGDGSIAVLAYERGRPPRGEATWKARDAHAAASDAIAWVSPATMGAKASPTLASVGRDCMLHLWAVEASPRSAPRKQPRHKPSKTAGPDAEAESDTVKPLASASLRDKPNAMASASEGVLLVADTSCELSVFSARS